jgi:hypothetical protein
VRARAAATDMKHGCEGRSYLVILGPRIVGSSTPAPVPRGFLGWSKRRSDGSSAQVPLTAGGVSDVCLTLRFLCS